MISPLDRYTSVPTVVEKATPVAGIDIAGAAGARITVLSNVACVHARTIEIFLSIPVDLNHVYIVNYAAERQIAVTTQLTGMLTAVGSPYSIAYAGPFGQTYDIVFELKAATPPLSFAKVWTAAKA